MTERLPRTCKAAILESVGAPLRLTEVTVPPLRDGEVLVRNEYTTLCRSDLNTFSGRRSEPTPTILGHETVGRIAAFGPDASRQDLNGAPLDVGDRITWAIFASDPRCKLSRRGIPQKGERLIKYGHERVTPEHTLHGGLSEYCILRPDTRVIRLAESIPLPVAATINCAVATVAGAIRLAGDLCDRHALISGVGMLGVLACAMARTHGASSVVAVDIDTDRLDMAEHFGADATIRTGAADAQGRTADASSPTHPFDVVLEFSGAPDAMETTLASLAIGGTAVWVGATYPDRPIHIDAEQVVRHLWTIKGLHNYNERDLREAVAFVERHHDAYPFGRLIHDGFAFVDADEAFAHALASDAYRVGVRSAL
jgi:putative phosphonate catabolism associated alcohol dehydrogenase